MNEKCYITASIDVVSSRPFMLGFPHLYGHRLGEYLLGELMFSTQGPSNIRLVIVNHMSSAIDDSVVPVGLIGIPEFFQDLQHVWYPLRSILILGKMNPLGVPCGPHIFLTLCVRDCVLCD